MLAEYPRYEQGHLLATAEDGGPGGVGVQPYFYIWAMGVIGSEIATLKAKEMEDDQKKRERDSRSKRW